MATLNLGRIKPVFRGAYAGGTAYVVDDIVTSGNETFICILASTGNATSNATYWTKLAAKGTDGTDGTDVGTVITTQGDILYRDSSGLQRLAKGTAGQVLKINSGATAPEWGTDEGGTVVQLVQKWMNTTTTQSGGGYDVFYDVSGFTQTFTPQKAGSKILVDLNATIGNSNDYGGMKVGANINSAGWNDIGMPDTSGSRVRSWIGNHYHYSDTARTQTFNAKYLWTPTYSLGNSIDFKVMWGINSGSTVVLNRSYSSTNSNSHYLGTSSLNLWEIN